MAIGKPKLAPARQTKKSRYAGIKAAAPREPMLHAVHSYRLRVLAAEETSNPGNGSEWHLLKYEIVELGEDDNPHHKVGDICAAVFCVGGNGSQSGLARLKAAYIAIAGFESEEGYDAFDPDGEFIDAQVGAKNKFSEAGRTIVGRLVDVLVTKGNATKDGSDYFREYTWTVVDEDTQDRVKQGGEAAE